MGPQCEDGYTKIANELLEAICRFRIPGESMQIFLVILRKTYGFGKKEDRISLSQFVLATGITKTHIPRAVTKLVELRIITKNGNGQHVTYRINKQYEQWQALPKKVTVTKNGNSITNLGNGVTKKGNLALPKKVHTKEKVTKETMTKETMTKEKGLLEICQAWKAYIEMRIKIKKPMTPYAMKLRIKDLIRLAEQGEDPIAVLNQSTAADWQDLYPVKDRGSPGKDKPKSFRERVNQAAVDDFVEGRY